MKRLLPLILALCAPLALADIASGTPHLMCTSPSFNTDGSAIPGTGLGSITSFNFYIDGALKKSTPPPCDWQMVVGDVTVNVAHSAQVTAVSAAGPNIGESAKSNAVTFTIPTPVPLAPTSVIVTTVGGKPHVTCTAPTLLTNGTSAAGLIGSFRFNVDGAIVKTLPTCDWQAVAGEVPIGSHIVKVSAVLTAGGGGAYSADAPFTLAAPGPGVPTGLTVQ